MKTTIDIADAILEESRRIAKRDKTTLRELVHEGLRRVLEARRAATRPFQLKPLPSVGGGFQAEFADGDWSRIRDEAYQGRGT